MKIILPYRARAAIYHDYCSNTIIELEENNEQMREAIVNTIYFDDNGGKKIILNCIDEDTLTELIDKNQELLHEYLTSHGYIFNKN